MESAIPGLIVLAIAYLVLLLAVIVGMCRAAKASRRMDEQAADPVNAAAEQLADELEALMNATRCDCPRCTAHRKTTT